MKKLLYATAITLLTIGSTAAAPIITSNPQTSSTIQQVWGHGYHGGYGHRGYYGGGYRGYHGYGGHHGYYGGYRGRRW
jgi:hypothetical protein